MSSLNVSKLSTSSKETLKKVFSETENVPWPEIEALFQELADVFKGRFFPATPGGPTRIYVNAKIGVFDYPHPFKTSITRVKKAKRFLKEAGIDETAVKAL